MRGISRKAAPFTARCKFPPRLYIFDRGRSLVTRIILGRLMDQGLRKKGFAVKNTTGRNADVKHGNSEKGPAEKRQSMHDGIGFWCDCCSCEAEPHWQEAAEKLGIDLSDRVEPANNC